MKKYTFTTKFLQPLLGIPKQFFNINNRSLDYTRYVDSYIGSTSLENGYKNCVFTILNNYQSKDIIEFEENLYNNENYIDDYEICNGQYIVVIFKIPDEFENDYEHFINGKYSMFSEKAQGIILVNNFSIVTTKNRNTIKAVFDKNIKLKNALEKAIDSPLNSDAELHSIVNKENETINDKVIKELSFINLNDYAEN